MARRPKAKTAYELLGRVCEAIKAHPLNYWQGYWKASRGATDEDYALEVCALPGALDVPKNTCGTAFCRAGWMVALHDGMKTIPDEGFESRAKTLLGYCADELLDVEYGASIDELFDSCAVSGTPGTQAYVREGIRGIRQFMKAHKARLQAFKLRGI